MDLRERAAGGVSSAWERARARTIEVLLRRHLHFAHAPSILDVGCGDAFISACVAEAYGVDVVGYDPSLTPSLIAELSELRPGVRLTSDPSVLRRPFDLVLMLDTLEHVADDEDYLRRAARCATEGLFVTVPGHPALFGPHDTFLGHHRRYSPSQFRELFERAGLEPMAEGSMFRSLVPLRALQNLGFRMTRSAAARYRALGSWPVRSGVDRLLESVLVREDRFLRHAPWSGLTLWALCVPSRGPRS